MVYIGQSHIVRKGNGLFSLRINNYIVLVVFLVFTLIGGELSPGIVFIVLLLIIIFLRFSIDRFLWSACFF